jgi:DNA polymerase-1
MQGKGSVGATFMMVGHAPGVEDDGLGIPFSGSNGRMLKTLLAEASYDLDTVYFTNALKCPVFDEKPKAASWKACRSHFRNELARVKPKAIVSFGAQALKWLTGFGGVRRFHRRGLPCVLDPDIVVYPFEQALSLQHYEGNDYYRVRARMISDFIWLRQRGLEDTLHVIDEIETDYKRARTLEEALAFLNEFSTDEPVYADFETGDKDFEPTVFPHPDTNLVLIGFSQRPGHARVIPYEARGIATLKYWTEEEFEVLTKELTKFFQLHEFVGHNFIQFDQKWTSVKFNIDQLNIKFEPMLAAHLLDEERGGHGLEPLAMRYTKMLPWKSELTVKDTIRGSNYLFKDLDAGSRIWPIIKESLDPAQIWLHDNVQVPMAHEMRRMEQRGVAIDREAAKELGVHLLDGMAIEEKTIFSTPEVKAWQLKNGERFNEGSPHHLRDLMENYLKLECIKRTDSGLYSTDAEVLEHYEDKSPLIGATLRLRRKSKLKSTYVDSVLERTTDEYNIVHYSCLLHGTVTGRPSFRDPNVGNIPREDTAEKAGIRDPKQVKAMFVPRRVNGVWRIFLQLDYSQAELRTLAMYSGDFNLTETYRLGLDAHAATAAAAYQIPIEDVTKGQRSNAKRINFGIIYGKQEQSLINDFVIAARVMAKKEGREFTARDEAQATVEAQSFLAAHKKAHPDVWRWMAAQEAQIRRFGMQETYFGRRRHFHKIDNAAIRQAYNFPIQSTAAEFTHIALIRCAKILRELGIDAYPVLTVYDSIVFSTTSENMWEVAEVCKHVMENLGFPFMTVPLTVDAEAGFSWGRLKNIDVENRVVLSA